MEIQITTKLIALLGKPLDHSFAARIQNEAFAAEGLDYYYYPSEVGNEDLKIVLEAARAQNYAGLVITKPNKVFVCGLLDELDPLAAAMQSVNTVVKTKDGRLVGYNTDGLACVKSLEDAGVRVKEERFFCIGAGGVGRSIAYTLAHCGAKKIWLTDVISESADALGRDINRDFPGVAEVVSMEKADLARNVSGQAEVIMNLTGLGMGKSAGQMPFTPEIFHPGQLAFDAIYNPPETRFLKEAKARGCRTLNGMNMNVYQGAIGFQLHTGRKAPIGQMRRTVETILAERAAAEKRREETGG